MSDRIPRVTAVVRQTRAGQLRTIYRAGGRTYLSLAELRAAGVR